MNRAIASKLVFFITFPLVRILQTDTVIIIAAGIQGQIACRVVPRRCEVRGGTPQTLLFRGFTASGALGRRRGTARVPPAATNTRAFLTPVAKYKL
jgi:hypothetical protein